MADATNVADNMPPGHDLCLDCGGDGKCIYCEGFCVSEGKECEACYGKGDCYMCHGKGYAPVARYLP